MLELGFPKAATKSLVMGNPTPLLYSHLLCHLGVHGAGRIHAETWETESLGLKVVAFSAHFSLCLNTYSQKEKNRVSIFRS